MIRIAHATDLHWFAPPGLFDLTPKRWFGTANLYLRGRRHEFAEVVQAELVQHLVRQQPDLALITGDITAQGLASEFDKARMALDPLLNQVPTMVIPGNHDAYTPSTVRNKLFAGAFGAWAWAMGPLARLDLGRLTVLGLDPCRATLVTSSGRYPEAQLEALARELASAATEDRDVALATHYPPVDRRGHPYDNAVHGTENVAALIDVLARAPRRPRFIASGHIHHGYCADLELPDGARIPVLNCGSSGQAHRPARGRTAATATYTLREDGSLGVERFLYDGAHFSAEPGGPFSS